MTKVEILTERQFLTAEDLQKAYACGRDTARRLIRQIKAISDIAKIKGKVTVTDYDAWFNFNNAKEKEECATHARTV